MNIQDNTTICAQATAAGRGAIAIIRLSGPQAAEILGRTFVAAGRIAAAGTEEAPLSVGKMTFGTIRDPEGNTIDEVMAAYFRGPRSYTGEDSAEIYCHGSQYIVSEIMRTLMANGAKLAGAGEFTQRAFLNGKLDLAQAEAVADLIASETKAAHDIALNQMRGGYSGELRQMREELLELVSLMELELDFSEEDVEFADRRKLSRLLEKVQQHVAALTDSFRLGNAIKNGIPVAIIGAVNTGKSTLLNALLKEERAIVSDIAGTTRDTVEDTVNIAGLTFRFIDTAGIRNTTETIEIIGIERTYTTLRKATVVLMVLDATRPEYFAETLGNLAPRLTPEQRLFILLNKTDLASANAAGEHNGNPAAGTPSGNSIEHSPEGSADRGFGAISNSGTMAEPSGSNADNGNEDRPEGQCKTAGGEAGSVGAKYGTLRGNEAQKDDALCEVKTGGSDDSSGFSVTSGSNEHSVLSDSGSSTREIRAENEADGSTWKMDIPAISPKIAAMLESIGRIAAEAGLSPTAILPIAAKRHLGIDVLSEALAASCKELEHNPGGTLVSNLRHYEALKDAQSALDRVRDGLDRHISTEFVAQDIREALYHIGSITGEVTTDEILGTIFGMFCIGK